MKQTKSTRIKDIKREWHLIDASDRVLGRISTEIANKLMGKNKPYFVPYMDCGDNVVVTNASKVEITGNKKKNKKYARYSGYPGGLKFKSYEELKKEKPEEIVLHAVNGMLPKNKLRSRMLKRLYVFSGAEHKFEDKFKKEMD